MNIKDWEAEVIKDAGERCQRCGVANGSRGYYLPGNHLKLRFKAFCSVDLVLVKELMSDHFMSDSVVTIQLSALCISRQSDEFNSGEIVALCQGCFGMESVR